ncbi:MAG: class I SAM-dependent methyltransferase [Gemmatimonadaceae bacterium]|jgi:2-polyprenyl-6-hydroxyphenyl methylase/3-demethylubiquinone-9 3-methyltransferase|nr:class I SAM-dependent methyltransferase [Gemmatimonadaceae bacterium]
MTVQTAGPVAGQGVEAAPGTPDRFAFGANWARFLETLDDRAIAEADAALARLLGTRALAGQRVLDIGSGSGLHSLAAWRLGADVTSFDYDADSVACTRTLQGRYAGDDARWRVVGQGSVLDRAFLERLGTFDVVYSWGVLHHTGALRQAVDNAIARVRPGGRLVIALYNDQGWISDYWIRVKRWYNAGPVGRVAMTVAHLPYLALRVLVRLARGRLALERGMSLWHDYVDWLGGWPFEVASPATVAGWVAPAGFVLEREFLVGNRQGCNEFVFVHRAAS